MNEKKYFSIGEFSKKTGISIRTLHYYDEIGLLNPEKNPRSGHRLYTECDVQTLQRIVTFKFLGYSLDEISEMMDKSTVDLSFRESLKLQQKALKNKKEHIELVLGAIHRIQVLLEDEAEIDSTVLIYLIRSIEVENLERKRLEKHIPEEIVSLLFDHSEETVVQGDKEFLHYVKRVKKLAGRPVDDLEVQELVAWWMEKANEAVCSTLSLMDEGMVKELKEIEGEETGEMPPSPFTEEEDTWLAQVMDYYFDYGAGTIQEEQKGN
ncbi:MULTISPECIES: MerR family transcriptional regulator [unclassified Bacillus cereus group]|uniref:MerR family transcriptional regulator n=1 Tax=unclassified Bacillus cereus group TaxID=2750818 RepID=UPI00339AE213